LVTEASVLLAVRCRIRERRKLQIIESREKRKVEKPRLPRTAKKIETKKMESQLGQLGLEIDADQDVSCAINTHSTVMVSLVYRYFITTSFYGSSC